MLRHEGRTDAGTGSPREIIKTAYKVYDFLDEEKWFDKIDWLPEDPVELI